VEGEGDSHYNIILDIIHSVPSIQFNDRDSLPPNGQLLNSIHCHEQWSSGRFSLFNYFKTSGILRRYAPAAAPALLAFVLSSHKSAARPFYLPNVPDHSPSSRFKTDAVMDFLKTNILNAAEHCRQTILSENGQATFLRKVLVSIVLPLILQI
jgi:hypothetical protein